MTLYEHLKSRDCDPSKYDVVVSEDHGIATFMLYNFAGKVVGFQTYNPNAPKTRNNMDPRKQKYFSYHIKEGYKSTLGFFGMETFDKTKKVVFLTEGIFDAVKVHGLGLNCLALLSNDPKRIKTYLRTMPYHYVAICDGDKAGRKMRKMGHEYITMPEGKDLGDMTQNEVEFLLKEYL
jgi:DNA primase